MIRLKMKVLISVLLVTFSSLYKCEKLHIGAVLSSKENQLSLKEFVTAANGRSDVQQARLVLDVTSELMDVNPIRSAWTICQEMISKKVHVMIASHPSNTDQSPISVSYTCGYYGIPLIGIHARDSAFSDKVKVSSRDCSGRMLC